MKGDRFIRYFRLISGRFPRTNLLSLMEDSHVYVCRRLVLELLKENADFSSVRQDFFPWLCKNQYLQSTSSKIGAFIHDGPEFPMRINSLQNFYEMNRRVCLDASFLLLASAWYVDSCRYHIHSTNRTQRPISDRSKSTNLN